MTRLLLILHKGSLGCILVLLLLLVGCSPTEPESELDFQSCLEENGFTLILDECYFQYDLDVIQQFINNNQHFK